jgi:hypothetical protein
LTEMTKLSENIYMNLTAMAMRARISHELPGRSRI